MNDDDWNLLREVCQGRRVALGVILQANRHRDDRSAQQRRSVIRELHAKGMKVHAIAQLCPLTPRAIQIALKRQNVKASV